MRTASERGAHVWPPPDHSGPNTVAQFGPNLLVLLGLPAITFTRRIVNRRAGHAEMGARRSPAPFAGSSVFARCRWRGEGSVTACGRAVVVLLAQPLTPITAGSTVRRKSPAAPGRRAGELFGRLPISDFVALLFRIHSQHSDFLADQKVSATC